MSTEQPDLSDGQVEDYLQTLMSQYQELLKGIDIATEFYQEGGRDRETWDKIARGLSHKAMGVMMTAAIPLQPGKIDTCERAVREASGTTPRDGGIRESVQQTVAKGLLMAVQTVGEHHMIDPPEWPDLLPSVVLGAVRSSKAVNADRMMQDRP